MARRPGRPKNPIPREVLLDRAAEVFADEGFGGASMGSIARRCDLQKSSLFHRFATKEALYLEVLDTYIGELGRLVLATGGTGGFVEKLDELGDVVTDYLGAHPRAARLILRELMDQGPYASGAGAEAVRRTLQLVSAFMSSGMDQGLVPRQEPMHLTMSICGLHLVWFATHEISGELVGGSVFDAEAIAARKLSVRLHVRRLVGVAIVRSVD
ncbi:MAG: TetR/AcrR family transcriptional regulator [Proteobacteria bacterium]|nr:TetR/AcrR family transcriptional regulator [Pseudomonadota bacterium]MCP4919053.1 TetR/AcrR family transcriptional regulator [Pseudomonadota bacterium]